MLDEELRSLTASEPLTLEEEYEMQSTLFIYILREIELILYILTFSTQKEKWQLDDDKLTFIILAPNPPSKSLATAATASPPPLDELLHTSSGLSPTDKRLADDFQMIGDVNIFLNGPIPSPQPSSPRVHLTTSSGNSNVSPLNPSARDLQDQNFFEEVKDREKDMIAADVDFQAEVEIMIAGTVLGLFLLLMT